MLSTQEVKDLKSLSLNIQMEILKMIHPLPAGHIGGALSSADLLSVLYGKVLKHDPKNPKWEERDWFVMSKGHCGPVLYATLALRGFFPMEELKTLNTGGTNLPSHCDRLRTTGVDMSTGSLGQGASTAAGVALAHKMDGKDNTVYLLLGDGEINEGQVWEMAMFASTRNLDNLIAFVDHNKLQIDGRTDNGGICNLGDICAKFQAFGWHSQRVDGHDHVAMEEAINQAKTVKGQPSIIVLDTIKGKGWAKIENTKGSHSCGIGKEDLDTVLASLTAELEKVQKEG